MLSRICATAIVVCLVGSVRGQDAPVLIELPPAVIPADVSASGFTVVGPMIAGGETQFGGQGFYWMPTTGVVPIGGTQAGAINADGRTIAGAALDTQGDENAAIWLGGTEWQVLGSFTPDAEPCDRLLSRTFGISDDGAVIVGLAWDGCRLAHGFRWTAASGMVDLGSTVPGRSSRANDVSGDGRVVVGWQDAPTGFRQGAVWRDDGQEVIVGPFGVVGEARDANSDGTLIVGQNCDPLKLSAWSWRPDRGVRCHELDVPVQPRPFITMMLTTSEDGSVIGGSYSFGPRAEAVLWLDEEPHFLKDYLRSNGVPDAFEGWINTGFIRGISRDGRVLVGQGAGPLNFQGYVVILP